MSSMKNTPTMGTSTGRLIWALSLLGFDRLVGLLGAGSSIEPHPRDETPEVLDSVADRVRDLISPSLRSIFEAGERILDRFFGTVDDWSEDLDAAAWPFPTDPHAPDQWAAYMRDAAEARPPHHAHPHPSDPGYPDPGYPDPSPPRADSSARRSSAASPDAPSLAETDDPDAWQPAPEIPDIATYFGHRAEPVRRQPAATSLGRASSLEATPATLGPPAPPEEPFV